MKEQEILDRIKELNRERDTLLEELKRIYMERGERRLPFGNYDNIDPSTKQGLMDWLLHRDKRQA